jgi:hypothetical protein
MSTRARSAKGLARSVSTVRYRQLRPLGQAVVPTAQPDCWAFRVDATQSTR